MYLESSLPVLLRFSFPSSPSSFSSSVGAWARKTSRDTIQTWIDEYPIYIQVFMWGVVCTWWYNWVTCSTWILLPHWSEMRRIGKDDGRWHYFLDKLLIYTTRRDTQRDRGRLNKKGAMWLSVCCCLLPLYSGTEKVFNGSNISGSTSATSPFSLSLTPLRSRRVDTWMTHEWINQSIFFSIGIRGGFSYQLHIIIWF